MIDWFANFDSKWRDWDEEIVECKRKVSKGTMTIMRGERRGFIRSVNFQPITTRCCEANFYFMTIKCTHFESNLISSLGKWFCSYFWFWSTFNHFCLKMRATLCFYAKKKKKKQKTRNEVKMGKKLGTRRVKLSRVGFDYFIIYHGYFRNARYPVYWPGDEKFGFS